MSGCSEWGWPCLATRQESGLGGDPVCIIASSYRRPARRGAIGSRWFRDGCAPLSFLMPAGTFCRPRCLADGICFLGKMPASHWLTHDSTKMLQSQTEPAPDQSPAGQERLDGLQYRQLLHRSLEIILIQTVSVAVNQRFRQLLFDEYRWQLFFSQHSTTLPTKL